VIRASPGSRQNQAPRQNRPLVRAER
jgi:hypothetical protein